MLRKSIIILSICAGSLGARSQSIADIQAPKLIPPSPDAAALGKYGQIPVDKSTGVPEISIPMYEIKTPRFTLPISLSYHGSGVRVDEVASWVGLGWSLNSGGVITRTVVGRPDDMGGYLFTTVPKASGLGWPVDSEYVLTTVRSAPDFQPDDYFYNFSGQSGAFSFDADKKPLLIPYKPLKISFDTVSGFHIIDEQGNFYHFNSRERVESALYGALISPISSWYLTEMISADLSDTIEFTYKQDSLVQNEFTFNFSQDEGAQYSPEAINILPGDGLYPIVPATGIRTYQPIRISSIRFKGGKVDFISRSGRLDNANVALDSVIVSAYHSSTASYSRLESFKLLTDYMYSGLSNPTLYLGSDEPSKHRLILTGLAENDQNNNSIKTHHFDYNQTMLPPVHNFGQDKWGYYNGQYNNPTLLETQNILGPYTGLLYTIGGALGANRGVAPDYAVAGVLRKITYPTGGFTIFNFESNRSDVPQESPLEIGPNTIGFFKEADTVLYTPTDLNIRDGGNIFHLQMRRTDGISYPLTLPVAPFVQITDLTSGNLTFFKAANSMTDIDSTFTIPLVAGQQYQIVAGARVDGANINTHSDSLPTASMSTSYLVITSPTTLVGGLRIASIQNLESDSSLLSTETYTYGADGTGGGQLLSAPFIVDHTTRTWYYRMSSGNVESAPRTTYCNNSVYQLSSLSGSPVGYNVVTVYHGTGAQNTGKSTYVYAIFSDSVLGCPSTYMNGLTPIPVTWKNGEPVRESHYTNAGGQYNLLQEKFNTYNDIYKKQGRGLIIGNVYETLGFDEVAWEFHPRSNYYWFDNPISTGVRVPIQTVQNDYDSTGMTILMTDTTSYVYDDTTLYMPTRTITADSKGHIVTLYTRHPLDKASIDSLTPLSDTASAAIDSMVARNMISPVIQQAQYRNGSLTQLALTNYKIWNSHLIAPRNIQVRVAGNPLDTRLQFNRYDSSGNPLELQKTNDVDQVYLWGYDGQYPVAKILNTTYDIAKTYITQSILDNPTDDATLRSQLNNLRTIPHAQATTYTYSPLVGLTSQTDVANRTTYYEYDGLQRLKRIRDQDHNILKTLDYQYQFSNSCGGNCFIVPMRTLASTNTLGYPVGVFNVHGKLLGNAPGPATFVTLWNSDTADAHVGTLAAGGDSLHFTIMLNTGKSLPMITGCRYYQVDLKWNQLDGVRNFNGAYVDFGDGTGMQMGRSDADTPAVLAPYTTVKSFTYTNFLSAGVGVPFSQVYLTHTYPDTTTTRTITFYHNDDTTNSNLDNAFTPATSLLKVTNLRGNLPAMTNGLGGSCYQQLSMTSVSGITNWNKISSVTNFFLNLGDGTHGVTNIGFAQDFMQNNKGLQIIDITGASDTSFKVSRLKTGWNTYFTNLQQLIINDYQWQREDLSALTNLWFFKFFATDPTGTSVIDNIINQMAVGAGRHINNGVINITYPGMDRTAASQSAYRMIKSKGWQVFINGVFE